MFLKRKKFFYVKKWFNILFLLLLLFFFTYVFVYYNIFSYLNSYFVNKIFYVKQKIFLFFSKKIILLKFIKFLIKENIFLKKKIFLLENKLVLLERLKLENSIFRKFFSLSILKLSKFIFAKIIFFDFLNKNNVFINKGSNFLLKGNNYYLVNNKGLLGKIEVVKKNISLVKLICDYGSVIPVQILRNNLRFNIYGNGCNNFLQTKKIPSSLDIQLGDIVVSSGIDNFYPVGYPVGIVSNIKFKKHCFCKIIKIKSFVNFNSLNYTLILSNKF